LKGFAFDALIASGSIEDLKVELLELRKEYAPLFDRIHALERKQKAIVEAIAKRNEASLL
jgi:hypothetical protein